MRRALVLTPDFPPAHGGIQALMHGVASGLLDHAPTVVTLGAPGARAHDRACPFPVRRVPAGARGHRASVAGLNAAGLAVAARTRPDVVLSGHVVAAPAALALRRLTGARVVQYVHADEFRVRPGLCGSAVRGADATIAVSRYTRDLAVAAGAPPAGVHLVHPGIDLPPAPPAAERAARPTIVTVARLAAGHKGHDVVLRALPAVRERVPDVHWVVIGDGPLRPGLERLAARLGVADAVTFRGEVGERERDAALDAAHVFAMPSRVPPGGVGGEGFGIAYLEAAAHGLAAVAGDRGGAVDAVVDGETGLLVDAADPAAVATALARLLTDDALRIRLGAAARTRAEAFAWPRVAAAVERVLAGAAA